MSTQLSKVAHISDENPTDGITQPTYGNSPLPPVVHEIPKSILSYSWDVAQPSDAQLRRAGKFFLATKPRLLFSAAKLLSIPFTSVPEVAFLGRSNVGKSSVLNAIMGDEICHTSSKPGRTRTMNAFAVGGPDTPGNKGQLNVLDMPGYGKGSHEDWGKEIAKYLVERKELKRVFVLVDSLHGLKKSDAELLRLLRHNGIPHQVLLSKVDRVLLTGIRNNKIAKSALEKRSTILKEVCEKLKVEIQPKNDGIPALGQILSCCTSAPKIKSVLLESGGTLGINLIRHALLVATGITGTAYKMAKQ